MYPMKMKPVYKDYLWGGERLAIAYGKYTPLRPLAESR
jgi:mannose-6-phosphate isomerase class I